MIMECVQVLKEIPGCRSQDLENPTVSGFLTEIKEQTTEQLQNGGGWNSWNYTIVTFSESKTCLSLSKPDCESIIFQDGEALTYNLAKSLP